MQKSVAIARRCKTILAGPQVRVRARVLVEEGDVVGALPSHAARAVKRDRRQAVKMLSGNSPCDFGEKHINGTMRSRHRRYARASSPGEMAKMEALCSDEPAILQRISLSEVYGCTVGERPDRARRVARRSDGAVQRQA